MLPYLYYWNISNFSLLQCFIIIYPEWRMAKAENTRATTRTNETWCFRKRSHGTLDRARSSTTSITGEKLNVLNSNTNYI